MQPMLASKAPLDLLALDYPIAAEIKHDGVRCLAYVRDDKPHKVMLVSRQGRQLKNFKEVEDYCATLPNGVYDGEVVSSKGFYSLMERTNAARGKNTDIDIEYKIFDKLTLEEYSIGESRVPYYTRTEAFPKTIVNSAKELEELYNKVLAEGKEGLVIKVLTSKYLPGRSRDWLKLKPKDTLDMTVVDYTMGQGAHNTEDVGTLYVEGSHEGHTVHTHVRSGFTKADIEYMNTQKEKLIGRTVEISYSEFTPAAMDVEGNITKSVRYAEFKCFRMDK